jgi:hypothetical protein
MKAFGNNLVMTGEMSTTLRTGINLRPIKVDQGIIKLSGGARLRPGSCINQGGPSRFTARGASARTVGGDVKFATTMHSKGRRLITGRPTTSDDERGR